MALARFRLHIRHRPRFVCWPVGRARAKGGLQTAFRGPRRRTGSCPPPLLVRLPRRTVSRRRGVRRGWRAGPRVSPDRPGSRRPRPPPRAPRLREQCLAVHGQPRRTRAPVRVAINARDRAPCQLPPQRRAPRRQLGTLRQRARASDQRVVALGAEQDRRALTQIRVAVSSLFLSAMLQRVRAGEARRMTGLLAETVGTRRRRRRWPGSSSRGGGNADCSVDRGGLPPGSRPVAPVRRRAADRQMEVGHGQDQRRWVTTVPRVRR